MNYYHSFLVYVLFCEPSWWITVRLAVWSFLVWGSISLVEFEILKENWSYWRSWFHLCVLCLCMPFASYFLCQLCCFAVLRIFFCIWTSLYYLKGTNPSFSVRLVCLPVQVLQVICELFFFSLSFQVSLSLILAWLWGFDKVSLYHSKGGNLNYILYNVTFMYTIEKIAYPLLWKPPLSCNVYFLCLLPGRGICKCVFCLFFILAWMYLMSHCFKISLFL